MDKLFSDLKNASKTKNSDDLLKKQQATTEKLTALLEQSASALSCGPTCQQLKTAEELKQKYLNAQTKLQTAPIDLENSKKNYYVFTEGEPYYNDMLEEELKKKAELIGKTLADNFNDEIKNAKTMNAYYNTDLNNSKNTKELYEMYLQKNQEIQKSIKDHHGDVLTNDRKTYYETEAIDKLNGWYNLLWYLYYIFVVLLAFALLFKSSIEPVKKIIILFLAGIYPYVINYIFKNVYGFFHSVWKQTPKNVYNDL
jgi:hypothetical protein